MKNLVVVSGQEVEICSQNASSGIIQSIFPVVYEKDNNFEILPYLDLSRKAEVWGFEILPNIVLAKKCRENTNTCGTAWGSSKALAEKCVLNGKKGSLPTVERLKDSWNTEIRFKIRDMDLFLCDNGIDGETRSANNGHYLGILWCFEDEEFEDAFFFLVNQEMDDCYLKTLTSEYDRLAVSF